VVAVRAGYDGRRSLRRRAPARWRLVFRRCSFRVHASRRREDLRVLQVWAGGGVAMREGAALIVAHQVFDRLHHV
jgi:hypothetical protein